MNVTENRLLLDSNIWLGYLLENSPETRTIVESNNHPLSCSVLSLHEIAKILGKNGHSQERIRRAVEFIRQNAAIVEVNETIALQAVGYCMQNRLHTTDSIIYATAMHENALFITADHDFDGLPNARLVRPAGQ
jgi:predicted nucleic acid-binding protein